MALTRAELIAAGIVVPGSTSAQSFIPTGNTVPANGLYLSGTNTIALATNNTGRIFIDASGNIGAGTNAPTSLLHVDGGIITSQRYENSGAIVLRRAQGTQSAPTAITSSVTLSNVVTRGYDGSTYRDVASIQAFSNGAVGSTSSPGILSFGTTPSGSTAVQERLRITSEGRIGIGTTSVPQRITINGGNAYLIDSGSFSPQVIIENTTDDATAGYFILSKSRAGTKNLAGDNLGTLLWRATNFDNAMSNTNTSLICDVTDTPTASGLVRTGLTVNSDRYIKFNTINGETARITDSNLLFIGHSSSQVVAQTSAKLEISGGDIGSVSIIRRSNNSFGANMYFAKSRNTTHNQYTILQNNDELGSIFFCGDDGTDFNHAGTIIRSYIDGDVNPIGTNKMPGGLLFMTNPGKNADDFAQGRMWITSLGHVGINAHPGEATLFRITGNGDGFGGYHNTVTVEPSLYSTQASNEARCVLTYPSTQAGATVSELQHIFCAQNTFDATSTVTTQIGLKILANLTGATNNWAIYSDIPTNTKGAGGTNTNFNVYVAGSAPSYFNSPVRIGNSAGRSNFYNTTGVPAIFQIEGAGSFPGRAVSQTFGATGSEGPIYIFAKHKSASIGEQTVVTSGDQLGVISFQGSDGTEFCEAASILALAEGTPVANTVPGALLFSTTAAGTSSPTLRATIDSSGRLLVGTASYLGNARSVISGNTFAPAGAAVLEMRYGATRPVSGDQLIGLVRFSSASSTASNEAYASITAFSDGPSTLDGDIPGRLVFNTTKDGASAPTEACRIDSSQRLLIGTTSARANFFNSTLSPGVQIEGTTDSGRFLSVTSSSSTANAPGVITLSHQKSNTLGGNTIVSNNDQLGLLSFQGSDGAEFVEAAFIRCDAEGTATGNSMPGRLIFATTGIGGSAGTEALRITSDGVVAYNQPTPTTKSAAATLTGTELKTKIIQYTGAANNLTLPTGSGLETALPNAYNNIAFEWSLINTGTGAATVVGNTGHTIVGNGVVNAGDSGRFASRRTASNTFVTYRLS